MNLLGGVLRSKFDASYLLKSWLNLYKVVVRTLLRLQATLTQFGSEEGRWVGARTQLPVALLLVVAQG